MFDLGKNKSLYEVNKRRDVVGALCPEGLVTQGRSIWLAQLCHGWVSGGVVSMSAEALTGVTAANIFF